MKKGTTIDIHVDYNQMASEKREIVYPGHLDPCTGIKKEHAEKSRAFTEPHNRGGAGTLPSTLHEYNTHQRVVADGDGNIHQGLYRWTSGGLLRGPKNAYIAYYVVDLVGQSTADTIKQVDCTAGAVIRDPMTLRMMDTGKEVKSFKDSVEDIRCCRYNVPWYRTYPLVSGVWPITKLVSWVLHKDRPSDKPAKPQDENATPEKLSKYETDKAQYEKDKEYANMWMSTIRNVIRTMDVPQRNYTQQLINEFARPGLNGYFKTDWMETRRGKIGDPDRIWTVAGPIPTVRKSMTQRATLERMPALLCPRPLPLHPQALPQRRKRPRVLV